MNRPEETEYNEYYETYISLVPETEIVPVLENQIAEIEDLVSEIPEETGAFAYAEGKWTIKEVLGHLADGERLFAYRALRISRADKTPIEGFEQDGYVENGNFNRRSLVDLTEELLMLRKANLYFSKIWTMTPGFVSERRAAIHFPSARWRIFPQVTFGIT